MTSETFIHELENFKQELEGGVVSHYRENDRERGWIAFKNWRDRVVKFLNKYTENKGDDFLRNTTLLFAIAGGHRESPYESFMRDYGKKSFAFLEELISETQKGNLVVSENIVEKKSDKKNNSSTEDSRIYNWLNKNAWILGSIISFILFVLSAMWFVRDKDFEPAITAIGSLVAFITLLSKRDIKGIIFVTGFITGIILTALLFYAFPQKTSEKIISDNKNNIENTNTAQQINSNLKISNSPPISTPTITQLPDTEFRKTQKNITVEVQKTQLKDSVFTITLLLTSNNVTQYISGRYDAVKMNAQNGEYRYPKLSVKGDKSVDSGFGSDLSANNSLEVQYIFSEIPNDTKTISNFRVKISEETFEFSNLKVNETYKP